MRSDTLPPLRAARKRAWRIRLPFRQNGDPVDELDARVSESEAASRETGFLQPGGRSPRRVGCRPRRSCALLLTLLSLLLPPPFPAAMASAAPEGKRPPRAHLVDVAVVERRPVSLEAEATGSLVVRRLRRVYSEEAGRVVELPWREGDRVPAGALLARLDDALLRAELDKAVARRTQAEADLRRLQGLSRKRLASEEALTAARTALALARAEEAALRLRIARTRILAPFAGVVTRRLAEPGDVVAAGSHLLTLVDPASLVARAGAPERIVVRLRPGDAVRLRIDALGTGWLRGRLVRVFPEVDPRTRQGTVEAVPEPLPAGAVPGLLARLRLRTPPAEHLVVPAAAVQRDPSGAYVFRVDAQGRARRTAVRLGPLAPAGGVVVLEGLAPGDRVVVRGLLGLRDGARVRVADPGPGEGEAP